MKKIIFVGEYMLCGGVEKSLISLLNNIDKNQYSITLLLLKKNGILLSQIPSYVNVVEMKLPEDEKYDILYGKKNALKKTLKDGRYIQFLKKLIRGAYINLISKSNEQKRVNYYRMIEKKFLNLNESYDIAIDYMGYGLLNTFFVAKKINAKKKLSWIHFEPIDAMENFGAFKNYLNCYDKLVCVSKEISKQMNNIMPELSDKLCVFYNIVDKEYILNLAKLEIGFNDKDFNGRRVLSIGRLDLQKGFDLVIPIIKKLVDEAYDIRWYIIGEGNLRYYLEELIKKYDLSNYVFLLGQKINPYSYLSQCDYYFQPSRNEGYGIAVAEARIFCKPILVTDFAGAKEQLKNNETGLIVKCNEIELYNGLKILLDNESISKKFGNNLRKEIVAAKNIRKDINQLFKL